MIIFDTETTGLLLPEGAPLDNQPRIIEFAAIKVNSNLEEVSRLDFLCHPGIPISAEITKITGLKDSDLADKKPFRANIKALQSLFLGVRTIIAHNLTFDIGMLTHELVRCDALTKFPWPPEQICTVEATYHIYNRRMSLGELYQHYHQTEAANKHRAIGDVETLLACMRAMRKDGIL